MVVIIENLSGITAGSPMVGTAIILVRRPINPGLIIDLWIMPLCPKTSEMANKQERKVEPPGIKPRASGIPCHCSATKLQLPPATTPHSCPYVAITFPSCSFAISEVFGHNGMIQRSIIRPRLIGIRTKLIGVPTIGLPAVIPLKFSMITVSMRMHAHTCMCSSFNTLTIVL